MPFRTIAPALLLLTVTAAAQAQILQPVNRFANPGESEGQTRRSVQNDEDDKGALLLSQASAQGMGTDQATLSLQAVDLWLSRKTRLYGRLTIPMKQQPAEEPAENGDAAAAEPVTKPSDSIVKQLVDPYGGVFNLSGGYFGRIGKAKALTVQEERIARGQTGRRSTTDAEAVAEVSKMQPDHGAFIDIRGGFKLIDLPNPGERALAVGESKLNLFYTGIAGLKAILPLYKRAVNSGSALKEDLAGGLTLGAYIVGNHAADATQSDIFTTALNKSTAAFTVVVGVNLPGIAGITFSATPWTNEERMGKMFVFGFDVLRPTSDDSAPSGVR